MTDTKPTRQDLGLTLTDCTKLSGELAAIPRHRREKKVKASVLGMVVMLVGVGVLAFTGFLAMRPEPSVLVLGGGAVLGGVILAFGGLAADRETFWPALIGIGRLAVNIIKARKA